MITRHEETLGPYIDWREHSLFNNSQFPQDSLTHAAHIHICQVSTLTGCQRLASAAAEQHETLSIAQAATQPYAQ